MSEAARIADAAATELEATDPELALRLEINFVAHASETPGMLPLVVERLPRIESKAGTSTPTRRLALAWLATYGGSTNPPGWRPTVSAPPSAPGTWSPPSPPTARSSGSHRSG
jgi:hypothetical protein